MPHQPAPFPVRRLTDQMILDFIQGNKELETPAKKLRDFIGGESVTVEALQQWARKVVATHLSLPSTGLKLCKWIVAVMCFCPSIMEKPPASAKFKGINALAKLKELTTTMTKPTLPSQEQVNAEESDIAFVEPQVLAAMEDRIVARITTMMADNLTPSAPLPSAHGPATSAQASHATDRAILQEAEESEADDVSSYEEPARPPGQLRASACVPEAMAQPWTMQYQSNPYAHTTLLDVDHPDILYFPMMWLDIADSAVNRRHLMSSLKEQSKITNPRHRDKMHQIQHLLQVTDMILQGRLQESLQQISDRILFLLHAEKKPLKEAIDFYEALQSHQKPARIREAEIQATLPQRKHQNYLAKTFTDTPTNANEANPGRPPPPPRPWPKGGGGPAGRRNQYP